MYNGGPVGSIIVAAGESRRMGGVNKMWSDLAGKPVLARSLAVFLQSPLIDSVVVVVGKNDISLAEKLESGNTAGKSVRICVGGERRQDSVAAGLKQLPLCEWVIVHDGARPLITLDLIEKGLKAAQETGAATAAVPVKDTIKSVDSYMKVEETLPRQRLWSVQTPQVFRFNLIKEAHRKFHDSVTDDASMIELLGHKIKVFEGSYDNIKITTPHDMVIAEALLKTRES